MTGTPLARTVLLICVTLLLALLAPNGGDLYARRGDRAKASKGKVVASKSEGNRKKSKRESRPTRHRYTLRGNPEVTRSVAVAVIAEKLPDLAALIGIERMPEDSTLAATTPEEDAASSPAITTEPTTASLPDPKLPVTKIRVPALPQGSSVTGGVASSYVDAELAEEEDPDKITDADVNALEELPTDINAFYKEFTRYMAGLNGESTVTDNGVDKVVAMETIVDWVGTRYLFGGMGRNGIDCSAYTGTLYRAQNFKLPRTAAAQWEVGIPVERSELQFGDLIFFNTRSAVYVSHVGMYLGNGMFTHASSRNGVTVSSLESEYYSTHMIGARRYDLNAAIAAGEQTAAMH